MAEIAGNEVGVASELYTAGTTEDGDPYTAEVYFVALTMPDGRVYRHPADFPGCQVVDTGDGIGFLDVRDEARASAQTVLDEVIAAGQIDLAAWEEMRPVYGSSAYQGYGQEAIDAAREKERG